MCFSSEIQKREPEFSAVQQIIQSILNGVRSHLISLISHISLNRDISKLIAVCAIFYWAGGLFHWKKALA
jgi:hypothetical protein